MANKKDLIEAQAFSRRRLLTAFTSGAPGGKELEPAKPLRAVFAGVALSVMVIVGGVFYGLMKPALAEGWDNNNVIIAKDTGARYVAFDGVLYPVLNATSARLLLPADKYKPIVTTSSAISKAPVGPTIGILGAPDDVPAAAALVADGWTACPSPEGTAISIPGDAVVAAAPTAALVRSDGRDYVVTGGTAYLVDERSSDAVLRAIGLVGITPLEVSSRWLNLFAAGAPFAPVEIAGEGEVVEGTDLVVGAAVQAVNSPDVYMVTADGELAPLSPLALQLYSLGTGAGASVLDVSQAEIGDLPTAPIPAGGIDWPADVLTPVAPGAAVCAVLGHDARALPTTALATTFVPPAGDGVSVTAGSGALVAAGGEGVNGVNEVFLVDQGGTSYGIPDAGDEVLAQLGYTRANVAVLTTAWMQFFASGPELTREAAAASPTGAGASTLPGSSTATPTPAPEPAASPAASAAPATSEAASADATSADADAPQQCEVGNPQYSTATPKPLALLQ
ncbi:MAG: type VII secretion protein EccB, partial [Demequinaceae bacterium]|nr:type VII secretion protein EccB [Demequinaceae bacterium]